MPGAVYVYRTRKPNALIGLPIVGRHFGYVGQSRNLKARHGEHLYGGGRYGKPPASWSDLKPKRYVLFKLPHCPQWLLDLMEFLFIRILFPVYNDKLNRGNPRRIDRKRAARMRVRRDVTRWSFYLGWQHLFLAAALVIVAWRVVQS
jgi:hypothetical protein